MRNKCYFLDRKDVAPTVCNKHALDRARVDQAAINRDLTSKRRKAHNTGFAKDPEVEYANVIDVRMWGHRDVLRPPSILTNRREGKLVTLQDHLRNNQARGVDEDEFKMFYLLMSRSGRNVIIFYFDLIHCDFLSKFSGRLF